MPFLLILILALLCCPSFSGPRLENLPAFCKSVYPKLIGAGARPLAQSEVAELLNLSFKSADDFLRLIQQLPIQSQRDLLEKLLVLRWQMKPMPLSALPEAFQRGNPEFTHPKREVEEAFVKLQLSKKIDHALRTLASSLGRNSIPEDQKKTFDYFLGLLDRFDPSWYHQSKIDSIIDLASGIRTQEISDAIAKKDRRAFNDDHQGEETYSFAKPELLLTPYSEIFNLFQALGLKPGDKVVDLGAGFGRLGLALASRNPGVKITGYEIVRDRIEEGARVAKAWGLSDRVTLIEQNLADPHFKPEEADIYFAFNPVSGATFDKVLEDLRQVGLKSKKPFRFIVFGPSPFEKTEAQPWLRELKGPEIPEGPELKIYEFVPEKATHTVKVEPTQKNPYALNETPTRIQESRPLREDELSSLSLSGSSSFLAPRYLQAWAKHWPIETFTHRGLRILFSKKTHEVGLELFFEPLGGTPKERAKAIEEIILSRRKIGTRAEFLYLSEEVVRELQASKSVKAEQDSALSDYIYPIENLAHLEQSKRLRERRNQAASFLRDNPDAQVQILEDLSLPNKAPFVATAQDFLARWQSERLEKAPQKEEFELDTLRTESLASIELAKTLQGPGTLQMSLTSGGKVLGYASGEIREGPQPGTKMLVIYVQKSDGTKNSIAYLNQVFVREVFNHPEKYGKVQFVNMMDASHSGLSQFKKHYGPDPDLGQVWKAY